MSFNKVTIYADGGCRGNGKVNNLGAYAYIVNYSNGECIEYSESFSSTTNNKMELLGVIKALESLTKTSVVVVCSDSKYVCDAVNQNWIANWQRNNWKTAKKEPVKNQDLWLRLIDVMNKHAVVFKWVKGHSDDELNNRCDTLLNLAMDNHVAAFPAVPEFPTANDVVGLTTADDVEKNRLVLRRLIEMRDELNVLIDMMK